MSFPEVASSVSISGKSRNVGPVATIIAGTGTVGVAFVSLRENLDLTTPAGWVMFQIIGAMANLSRP